MSNNDIQLNGESIPMRGVRYVDDPSQYAIYLGKRRPSKPDITKHPMEIEDSNYCSEPEDINSPPMFLKGRKSHQKTTYWTISSDSEVSDSEDTPLERMVFKRRSLRMCTMQKKKLEDIKFSVSEFSDELKELSKTRNNFNKKLFAKLTKLNEDLLSAAP
ncbi:unnamed protein product [Ceratitis capitata]|uniref:(Mediterranean fruit fly) hypothetical protein n=1 Tax=Ceratitis capitata TaxID=7213 RepID=A0A811U7N2_CERCA|nr:unnamed protein product [Ceratitis capitata]